MTIDPKAIHFSKMHGYLLGAVTPRPIAFASTIDENGNVNLSPFSFFNCFGANPPIVVFSPARRGKDNSTKHTYENVKVVPEVVISIVNYDMVQQTSLASTDYARGVNEFIKAGFTEVTSEKVRPPRVAESPISMECKVLQVIETGSEGASGNLVICEVLLMHIKDDVLDEQGRIDPWKLDAVARLGQEYYCRVSGESIFKVAKPLEKLGIGVDAIPEAIRLSKILTGNDLGMLGNVEILPDKQSITEFTNVYEVRQALQQGDVAVHQLAHQLLSKGEVDSAWKVLLANQS